jgi:hypothetical protein
MGKGGIAKELSRIISNASCGQRVVEIRLSVGKGLSVSVASIASHLHSEFPHAEIVVENSPEEGSVTVRDIKVE